MNLRKTYKLLFKYLMSEYKKMKHDANITHEMLIELNEHLCDEYNGKKCFDIKYGDLFHQKIQGEISRMEKVFGKKLYTKEYLRRTR